MKNPRLTVLLAAALMLLVSFAGGATAGALITGADIKDGSLTTKDVKDATLKTGDLSSGAREDLARSGLVYYNDQNGYNVGPGADKSFSLECAEGMTAIAASGGFLVPDASSPSTISKMNETTYSIDGHNGAESGDNYLWMYVTCAKTQPYE